MSIPIILSGGFIFDYEQGSQEKRKLTMMEYFILVTLSLKCIRKDMSFLILSNALQAWYIKLQKTTLVINNLLLA